MTPSHKWVPCWFDHISDTDGKHKNALSFKLIKHGSKKKFEKGSEMYHTVALHHLSVYWSQQLTAHFPPFCEDWSNNVKIYQTMVINNWNRHKGSTKFAGLIDCFKVSIGHNYKKIKDIPTKFPFWKTKSNTCVHHQKTKNKI